MKNAGTDGPVQVSVFMQSCQRSSESVRSGSKLWVCTCLYLGNEIMWNNNGVNMLLLVFELLDIIINPTSEKKIKKKY